jgi:rod shape-determining protein MreD
MTRRDFLIKWGVYALAILPVWWCELFLLNRLPLPGASPMLLPLAAVAVAVLEGSVAGAGYGLFVGVLCDAVYYGTDGAMTVGLCLLGMLAGALAQYALRQNLLGCLVCSLAALTLIDFFRVVYHLISGSARLSALLAIALPEILWSMVFVLPVYGLYLWVFRRVPKKTVL